MLRRWFVLPGLLLLAAFDASAAQAGARQDAASSARSSRSGTWSANNGRGMTLMGTWTAVPDSSSGTVTGTWTLADAKGGTLANGAWSAAKAPSRWTGAWRAVIAGRAGEYTGTWTSGVDLRGETSFDGLFEQAVLSVVSGGWRAGAQSGAWAIRAAKRE